MYIVSYDIASDRLRNRIARTLEGYGRRVQYSVFECELSEKRYKELYEKLLKLTEASAFILYAKTVKRKSWSLVFPKRRTIYFGKM